jgi:hypothetical protein
MYVIAIAVNETCKCCSRAFGGNLERDEQQLKDHRLRTENNMETTIKY